MKLETYHINTMDAIISKEMETALIEGQTFIKTTEKIKSIVSDFNSDSGLSKSELFLLGVELGKLYEYECEYSARGNNFEAEIINLISEIEKKLTK